MSSCAWSWTRSTLSHTNECRSSCLHPWVEVNRMLLSNLKFWIALILQSLCSSRRIGSKISRKYSGWFKDTWEKLKQLSWCMKEWIFLVTQNLLKITKNWLPSFHQEFATSQRKIQIKMKTHLQTQTQQFYPTSRSVNSTLNCLQFALFFFLCWMNLALTNCATRSSSAT